MRLTSGDGQLLPGDGGLAGELQPDQVLGDVQSGRGPHGQRLGTSEAGVVVGHPGGGQGDLPGAGVEHGEADAELVQPPWASTVMCPVVAMITRRDSPWVARL